MDAKQFCGEYARELKSGRISFSKKKVDEFIKTYTNLQPDDFTKEMRKRLIISIMIDFYDDATTWSYTKEDLPAEKIELPEFIFK